MNVPAASRESTQAGRHRNLAVFAGTLLLLLLVFFLRHRIRFDWPSFFRQLHLVDLRRVLFAIAIIYASYYLRALRWSIFLRPVKHVSARALVGPQFIGFTATAIFGRFADLTRPYLIARRAGLSFASQVAVYTVERMFDLGATAVLFSLALALTPRADPHYHVFFRAGIFSLIATVGLGLFALAVYLAGEAVARLMQRTLGRLSSRLAGQAAEKLLAFRHGLTAISSFRDLFSVAAISLLMWSMVGEAYVQSIHAFVHVPELASLSYSRTMLLMAVGIGGSVVQLPILGWFTQIAFIAAAMHAFYGAPLEAATACSAVLQIVLWISIIPVGLLWSRIGHISLKAAETSAETTRRDSPLV